MSNSAASNPTSSVKKADSPVKVSASQEDGLYDHPSIEHSPIPSEDDEEELQRSPLAKQERTQTQVPVKLDPSAQSQPRKETQDAGQQPKTPERDRVMKTPESKQKKTRIEISRSPSTPGHLAPFDWDDFEARYTKALDEAGDQEKQLLEEFDQLVQYFNVWATTSSAHDTERAVKRLQTRERYVQISEQKLLQKKQHLSEVVRAFQSALALLKSPE